MNESYKSYDSYKWQKCVERFYFRWANRLRLAMSCMTNQIISAVYENLSKLLIQETYLIPMKKSGRSNAKNVSGKTLNAEQTSKNAMGSVSTFKLDNVNIEYNNTFDCVQENEDDWISSCLGSEYDVVNSLY